jgi:hypothetical protein
LAASGYLHYVVAAVRPVRLARFTRFTFAIVFAAALFVLLGTDGDARARPHRRHTGCPPNMMRVQGFCIDCYEAPNRRRAKPLAMQSANDAEGYCEAHHKRLCTEDEWQQACAGDDKRAYPYGAERRCWARA